VVTFDDGWRDNYTVAYPVLKKYAIPAIIFLTTDYINTNKQFWFQRVKYLLADDQIDSRQLLDVIRKAQKDYNYQIAGDVSQYLLSHSPSATTDYFIEWLKNLDLATINGILNELADVSNNTIEGDEPLMLSWAEVVEMSKSGIDFGSHGLSHRIMTGMNIEDVRTELVRSREIIREQTGQEATIFAYPNGDCNDDIKKAVKDAGYYAAAATYGNQNDNDKLDLYGLTRVAVHEGISIGALGSFSRAIFRCRLHGII
jgi:peptidoglycan/xylan/chitin deacetylase (PgdA/CDA1 family)